MKILLTGGAGFIGSNIVDSLISSGHDVVIVDNMSRGKKANINPEATFYEMDILSPEMDDIFNKEKITHLIHHAAQIDVQHSIQDPIFDASNNISGTIKLLEYCKKYDLEKFIYASSAAVYGDPDYLPVNEKHPIKAMSPYGISKHTPEHYIKMYHKLYGLKYTILRYANIYGQRQDPKGEGGVISIFIDKMLAGLQPIIFGDGEQSRDFIHVNDIVNANLKALEKGDNQLVNISCNTQNTVNDIYQIINDLLHTQLEPIYKEERKGDIRHSYLDNTKALKVLNWEPEYNLREGLKLTIDYYADLQIIKEAASTKE